jgi:hypothetical protein
VSRRRVLMTELPEGTVRSTARQARELRPIFATVGTSEAFRAMAGGQAVYESPKPSQPPDYSEALRRYNLALGLSEK